MVGKVTAERFVGSRYLRGAERPDSTYEYIVDRITDGQVAESTAYINWLDPYVQVGLVDLNTLTSWHGTGPQSAGEAVECGRQIEPTSGS